MTHSFQEKIGVLALALFVINVPGLYLYAKFLSRLREQFADTWVRLGSPNLLTPTSSAEFGTFLFIVSGEYRRLKDPKLSDYAFCLNFIMAISIALMLLFIFLAR